MRASIPQTAPSGTVHIVDDDSLMRESLQRVFEFAGFHVDSAGSAAEFLSAYRGATSGPECLVLDICLPDMNGLDLHGVLRQRGIAPATIFLSGRGDISTAVRAIHSGGVDFLEKPVSLDQLLERARHALTVDVYCRHRLQKSLVDLSRFDQLSARERDVLQLLVQARTVKQISAQLQTGLQTIAKHKQRILRKLGVANDAELAVLVTSLVHADEPNPSPAMASLSTNVPFCDDEQRRRIAALCSAN